MPVPNTQMAVPSSWGLGLALDRPISLAQEAASFPKAYQEAFETSTRERAVSAYLRSELQARGTRCVGDPSPDVLTRQLLETRFHQYLSLRANEDRPYYYGYYRIEDAEGRPVEAYNRLVGLLPHPFSKAQGILLDFRGYGHGLEHDLDRIDSFLNAGFAVFTADRAEHGLSARLDPGRASLRSSALFVRHAAQTIDLAERIRGLDPRLKGQPVYALASSLGGAELVGAMREAGSGLGLEALILDNPLLSLGSKHPWYARWMLTLIRGAFEAHPAAPNQRGFYRRRTPPTRYAAMKPAVHEAVVRYFKAYGPNRHPPVILDLQKLLQANTDWLSSAAARTTLPRTLFFVTEDDEEVSPDVNAGLFGRFSRTSVDAIRHTEAHSPFLVDNDAHLVPDILAFLGNRRQNPNRVYLGPENAARFAKARDERRRKLKL